MDLVNFSFYRLNFDLPLRVTSNSDIWNWTRKINKNFTITPPVLLKFVNKINF